ncbi:MAG: DNA repair protein RecN [Megasphaera sp.]|jgi:DNA repair protein RecN (Recombination protein N)|nr:DNA repair protein RecN [Megasphaera sp.]
MLQSLHIHNFALIEDLHMTFGEGVTIFTGETGAGKSILLDAIGMLAGKRASASFVRTGTDAFLVEGAFFFIGQQDKLMALLEENHIEWDDGQLIISRQFHKSGRGTILVNGTMVPTAVARKIGSHLLDIHGQFDNQLIFDPSYHVTILDTMTAALQQARRQYDALYVQWRTLRAHIKSLQHDESEKARLLSILDFQIKEIEGAALQPGEDEELERDINKAAHSEHIKNNLRDALFRLEGGERQKGAAEQIEAIHRSLEKASAYDDAFQALAAKVETLSYELEDVHDGMLRYASAFDFDEHALDTMQARLAAIEKLKRKYGFTVTDILAFLAKAKEEYERLEQSESTLQSLQQDLKEKEAAVRKQGDTLMELRLQADTEFRKAMGSALVQLGMPHSRIAFHIEPMKEITPDGAAHIELYFSANTGEDMQPLAKIASGGEVSRIALALKTSSHALETGKTIIFDEIDVGISGQTGLQVAYHIRKLRDNGQVFCITHLPQTAAIADHHYFIYKQETDGRTVTQIRKLSESEHILEIARMFAGNDTTKASIEAARQIVDQVKL